MGSVLGNGVARFRCTTRSLRYQRIVARRTDTGCVLAVLRGQRLAGPVAYARRSVPTVPGPVACMPGPGGVVVSSTMSARRRSPTSVTRLSRACEVVVPLTTCRNLPSGHRRIPGPGEPVGVPAPRSSRIQEKPPCQGKSFAFVPGMPRSPPGPVPWVSVIPPASRTSAVVRTAASGVAVLPARPSAGPVCVAGTTMRRTPRRGRLRRRPRRISSRAARPACAAPAGRRRAKRPASCVGGPPPTPAADCRNPAPFRSPLPCLCNIGHGCDSGVRGRRLWLELATVHH